MATHFSGPVIGGGQSMGLTLDMFGTALSGASGTVIDKWRCVLPNVPTTLSGIGVAFTRGGTTPPQGGTLRFKVFSGNTGKGLFSGSVAGATAEAVMLTGAATFPAAAHFQMSVHTAGATQAGRGARPTLYLGLR